MLGAMASSLHLLAKAIRSEETLALRKKTTTPLRPEVEAAVEAERRRLADRRAAEAEAQRRRLARADSVNLAAQVEEGRHRRVTSTPQQQPPLATDAALMASTAPSVEGSTSVSQRQRAAGSDGSIAQQQTPHRHHHHRASPIDTQQKLRSQREAKGVLRRQWLGRIEAALDDELHQRAELRHQVGRLTALAQQVEGACRV